MKYENIVDGIFLERVNRFTAVVDVAGSNEICHIKNTGRCKEILIPGAKVFLQKIDKIERKTKYDLISVYKGESLINIDSQAPNTVFGEWVRNNKYFGNIKLIKPECKYKNSRFDYYIETDNKKIFIEVKGVTLEEDGVVSFPDAPSKRGVKHLKELSECVEEGYEAYIFFVVQMDKAKYFTPNRVTHSEFADELVMAANCGVSVKCVNCNVSKETLFIKDFIKIVL